MPAGCSDAAAKVASPPVFPERMYVKRIINQTKHK